MRELSARALNRAILARQGLLERRGGSIAALTDRMAGLQAQYAPSMYIGLRSRLRGFARTDLDRALERGTVVQATLMRGTIHLVGPSLFWPLAIATRESRRQLWLRNFPGRREAEYEAAAERLDRLLADGPMRMTAIDAELGKDLARGVGSWIDLVRVPPSGTWVRRRADLVQTAARWVGDPPAGLDETAARERLVECYLRGFGPATREGVMSWSGLGPRETDAALGGLALRRFDTADGTELHDLPRLALPDPEVPAPPRLLGTWDAALLVHARHAGVLPERHRSRVFSSRRPHSHLTFILDGAVAGTWTHSGDGIELEPFEPLRRPDREALEAEARRMAELFADPAPG